MAGLVAWVFGLVMWATSLSFVRRRFYDIFFSVHHLYLLFSLFWLYHAVWNYHFFIVPVMLFFIDRFLRMIQSSTVVRVSSAKLLENGAVELSLPLNPNATKGNNILNGLNLFHLICVLAWIHILINIQQSLLTFNLKCQ